MKTSKKSTKMKASTKVSVVAIFSLTAISQAVSAASAWISPLNFYSSVYNDTPASFTLRDATACSLAGRANFSALINGEDVSSGFVVDPATANLAECNYVASPTLGNRALVEQNMRWGINKLVTPPFSYVDGGVTKSANPADVYFAYDEQGPVFEATRITRNASNTALFDVKAKVKDWQGVNATTVRLNGATVPLTTNNTTPQQGTWEDPSQEVRIPAGEFSLTGVNPTLLNQFNATDLGGKASTTYLTPTKNSQSNLVYAAVKPTAYAKIGGVAEDIIKTLDLDCNDDTVPGKCIIWTVDQYGQQAATLDMMIGSYHIVGYLDKVTFYGADPIDLNLSVSSSTINAAATAKMLKAEGHADVNGRPSTFQIWVQSADALVAGEVQTDAAKDKPVWVVKNNTNGEQVSISNLVFPTYRPDLSVNDARVVVISDATTGQPYLGYNPRNPGEIGFGTADQAIYNSVVGLAKNILKPQVQNIITRALEDINIDLRLPINFVNLPGVDIPQGEILNLNASFQSITANSNGIVANLRGTFQAIKNAANNMNDPLSIGAALRRVVMPTVIPDLGYEVNAVLSTDVLTLAMTAAKESGLLESIKVHYDQLPLNTQNLIRDIVASDGNMSMIFDNLLNDPTNTLIEVKALSTPSIYASPNKAYPVGVYIPNVAMRVDYTGANPQRLIGALADVYVEARIEQMANQRVALVIDPSSTRFHLVDRAVQDASGSITKIPSFYADAGWPVDQYEAAAGLTWTGDSLEIMSVLEAFYDPIINIVGTAINTIQLPSVYGYTMEVKGMTAITDSRGNGTHFVVGGDLVKAIP